jgi:signal transduction histidine kinase
MADRAGSLRETASSLLDRSPSHLVAASRLLLAAFALAAIWADPNQPARFETLTYWILGFYLVHAAALMVAALRLPSDPGVQVAAHAFDIVAFSVLMLLTEGPTSPFFVFFTFALVAATVHWGWRGALATGVAVVVVFAAMGLLYGPTTNGDEEVTRRIIRAGYLVVAAGMLGYLGFVLERARARLALFADWPEEPPGEGPPIAAALEHARRATGARRAVALWEAGEEPWLHVAVAEDGQVRFRREPPVEDGPPVAEGLAGSAFLVVDAAAGIFRRQRTQGLERGRPLEAGFVATHGVAQAVVAPVRTEGVAGHLVLVDPRRMSEHLLPMATIAARRIGGELEHDLLRQAREEAAALSERARVARDVHDGILQALTATAMRLRAAEALPEAELRRALAEIGALVTGQQRWLRRLVEVAREGGACDLRREIGEALGDAARHWGCEAELEVEPASARVPRSIGGELSFIVSEAVANAVRHASASRVAVRIEVARDAVDVTIRDNGAPPEGPPHARAKVGGLPKSLRERLEAVGGQIRLSCRRGGQELSLRMPLF